MIRTKYHGIELVVQIAIYSKYSVFMYAVGVHLVSFLS